MVRYEPSWSKCTLTRTLHPPSGSACSPCQTIRCYSIQESLTKNREYNSTAVAPPWWHHYGCRSGWQNDPVHTYRSRHQSTPPDPRGSGYGSAFRACSGTTPGTWGEKPEVLLSLLPEISRKTWDSHFAMVLVLSYSRFAIWAFHFILNSHQWL